MNIRSHIETLANGESQRILDEIENEVQGIESFLCSLVSSFSELSYDIQMSFNQMKGQKDIAVSIAKEIDNLSHKEAMLKQKSCIKKIADLEDERKNSSSPHVFGRLNRELQFLKNTHTRELSEYSNCQQRLIVNRLQIIEIWKTILTFELNILESSKKYIISNIINEVNATADQELLDMVREKIKSINTNEIKVIIKKLDSKSAEISNVAVLRKSLISQLDNVVHIEKTVVEKRKVVHVLKNIITEIKKDVPEEAIQKQKVSKEEIEEQVSSMIQNKQSETTEINPKSRMAYQNRE